LMYGVMHCSQMRSRQSGSLSLLLAWAQKACVRYRKRVSQV